MLPVNAMDIFVQLYAIEHYNHQSRVLLALCLLGFVLLAVCLRFVFVTEYLACIYPMHFWLLLGIDLDLNGEEVLFDNLDSDNFFVVQVVDTGLVA